MREIELSDDTACTCNLEEHGTDLRKSLSESSARHLEDQAWSIVPGLFQSLNGFERLALLEVGCDAESPLTAAVHQLTGTTSSAGRCSLWNGCDVGESEGLSLVLQRIEVERPQVVWLNPPSSSYSPLQKMNQKTGEQQEALNQKRLATRRAYVGYSAIFHFCVQQGIHVVWAMLDSCLAWRLPLMHQLQVKYKLHDVTCKGCAVNLRDSPGGRFVRNGWRILTTHARLAQSLDLPCRCPKEYQHASSNRLPKIQLDQFTPELAKRAAKYLLQELSYQGVLQECAGQTVLPEAFGVGDACVCSELQIPNLPPQKCSNCLRESSVMWGPEILEETNQSPKEDPQTPGSKNPEGRETPEAFSQSPKEGPQT